MHDKNIHKCDCETVDMTHITERKKSTIPSAVIPDYRQEDGTISNIWNRYDNLVSN